LDLGFRDFLEGFLRRAKGMRKGKKRGKGQEMKRKRDEEG